MIKTVGNLRNLDLIKTWVVNGDPFLLVGPEGCGKNMTIKGAFAELNKKKKIMVSEIPCNA